MVRESLSSILHNKILLFNIIVISAVIIFLLITNIQHEVDLEEYVTIPYDHSPILREPNEYTDIEVIYDKDTFQLEYSVFKNNNNTTHCISIEDNKEKALPMSPTTTVYFICGEGVWTVAVAVKKITDEPAVYMLKVNDRIVAYFSDPFPTGYNSILLYSTVADAKIKIEINKVERLG